MTIYDISKINFGILSADDIKKMAVCKIDNQKVQGPNSVYDPRMGCVESYQVCATCGRKSECQGHYGYIELAEPILHPMLNKSIALYLNCFCKKCHRFLLKEEQIKLYDLDKLNGQKRFEKLKEKIKKIDSCSHCDSPQPKIIYKSKENIILMEYKQKKGDNTSKLSIQLEVDDIKKIFDNILDSDVKLMGFDPDRTHPRNLILTVLPVVPPCSRPYVVAEGNICDDDLTYQLTEIIKANNGLLALNENKNNETKDKEQKRQKFLQSLKFRIATMFDNSGDKAKHPTDSRALKGFKERLSGKFGRLRSNLMGKRVDFSARTVIGADPTLKLNQLGVPIEVTKILTKPEIVTEFNMKWLTSLIEDGKTNYVIKNKDGKKVRFDLRYATISKSKLIVGDIIVKDPNYKIGNESKNNIKVISGKEQLDPNDRIIRNGKFIDIKNTKKNINLNIGDIVERHLQKGDIVLLNRQPTLHRGGMLAMEIVPMTHKSFRLNLAITPSFNADFDGDEMNIHVPQSLEAEAELRLISAAQFNIITPQESKPVIVIKQDALVASYLMTRRFFQLTKSQFSDICLKCERIDGSPLWNADKIKRIEKIMKMHCSGEFNKNIFNGRGLISLILPENLNYEKKNNAFQQEPIVKIKEGVFIEGAFDKNILGSAHGSLIQILNKEYGSKVVSNFIDNMQFIGNAWLMVHGFSIGLEDCIITSSKNSDAIKNKLTQCYTKAEGIKETTRNPGICEMRIAAALSEARDVGMKIAKDAMNPLNNILVTVTAGAKGDLFNIAQITGIMGQQNINGRRIMPSISHGKRTLPHYPFENIDKDREYEAHGFISHSFIRGLEPEEFWSHAKSGREGVISTAMKTADTGYIQRRTVKNLEDIKINYDQTVRDANGKIIQFAYGQNYLDSTKTIKVDSVSQICDISRLASRLNTSFELKLKEPKPFIMPQICLKTIEEDVPIEEKQSVKKLIEIIKHNLSYSLVNETWTVEQLQQRIAAFNLEEDEKGEDEDIENEDIEEEEEKDDEEEKEDDEEEKEDDEEEEEKDENEGDEDIEDDVEIEDDFVEMD